MHPRGALCPDRDRNEEKDSASCCADLNLVARSTVSPRPGMPGSDTDKAEEREEEFGDERR